MYRLPPPDRTYSVPVDVDLPGDGGGTEPAQYTAVFRLLGDGEVDALTAQSYAALLRRAVADWRDVHGADGEPLPCTPEHLDMLCAVPHWRRATVSAYMRWIAGLPRKNSRTPPCDG